MQTEGVEVEEIEDEAIELFNDVINGRSHALSEIEPYSGPVGGRASQKIKQENNSNLTIS